MNVFKIKFILLLSFWKYDEIQADVYTSMSDINTLVKTEGEIIRTVENYIEAQELKLLKLRSDLKEMAKVHEITAKSPEQFLSSPINSFLLVKRLTVDWRDLQAIIESDEIGKGMLADLNNITKFPDDEDLNGVAIGLMRLQDTYQLETSQIAKGFILGVKSAYRELSASDCFELGRQSYNSGDFYHTLLWMTEALQRIEREDKPSAVLIDILEYLAFATYKENHLEKALQLTNRILHLQPSHSRALGNRAYYEKQLLEEKDNKRGDTGSLEESVRKGYTVRENNSPTDSGQRERTAYERLCRGESKMPLKVDKKLTCFYQTGPSKFLRLAPVKTEVAFIHPTIVMYHDVIYDAEIEIVKTLAIPRFKRATVSNYKTGELETASYRISKSSWLREEDSPIIRKINSRVGSITGLNIATAEDLQVANYGIGGHYDPHFDFARREEKETFKSLGTGNRIATFLFYMSDVEAGGSTVFPHLEVALRPKKGAAAFWFNLYPSGEGDTWTRHAACPVLLGSKWVSNKWIHERGQEFNRPCTLNFEDPNELINYKTGF